MNRRDAGNQIFKMLGFQYNPLEQKFLRLCDENNQPEMRRKYQQMNSMRKIELLDKFAGHLGL